MKRNIYCKHLEAFLEPNKLHYAIPSLFAVVATCDLQLVRQQRVREQD